MIVDGRSDRGPERADEVIRIFGNQFSIPLSTQFSSRGLTLTPGSLLQANFFDGNALNHFISASNPTGTLSTPVFGISIQSNCFWNATLTLLCQIEARVT